MIKKIFGSELGRGVFYLFLGMNVFNILNFLFHFLMGRILGPADYGTLAVLLSLISIYSIPTEAIQNIITKYSSALNVANNRRGLRYLFVKSSRILLPVSLVSFVILNMVGIYLSVFLGINFWVIFLINLAALSMFFGPITRGMLQGTKRFKELAINFGTESVIKIALAISLVYLGFGIFGATVGAAISIILGVLISLYFISDLAFGKREKVRFSWDLGRILPYFSVVIVILFILGIDVLLAKRFFLAEEAGRYAVLSVLGKIIFLGTQSVGKVLFPLSVERVEKKKSSRKLFLNAFFVIFLLSAIGLAIYFIFPELIILLLYGEEYLSINSLLVFSGISMAFLSLTNLSLLYALSTDKLENTHFLLYSFIAITSLMLFLFHNTLEEYVFAFMFSNIIMFICSTLFIKKWKIFA